MDCLALEAFQQAHLIPNQLARTNKVHFHLFRSCLRYLWQRHHSEDRPCLNSTADQDIVEPFSVFFPLRGRIKANNNHRKSHSSARGLLAVLCNKAHNHTSHNNKNEAVGGVWLSFFFSLLFLREKHPHFFYLIHNPHVRIARRRNERTRRDIIK